MARNAPSRDELPTNMADAAQMCGICVRQSALKPSVQRLDIGCPVARLGPEPPLLPFQKSDRPT